MSADLSRVRPRREAAALSTGIGSPRSLLDPAIVVHGKPTKIGEPETKPESNRRPPLRRITQP
jgi:hypothetical protein